MFQRYTEKARRVIFFSRYEASQFGSPSIETEHLLLGLIREDKALLTRFIAPWQWESIRQKIEKTFTKPAKPTDTSIDLPLSNECKRVLAYGAEEAERLSHQHIGTEHILLGLLREEKAFAAGILKEFDVKLPDARKEFERVPHHNPDKEELLEKFSSRKYTPPPGPFTGFSVNLVVQAGEGKLSPLVGRQRELEQVIQILSRLRRNNVVLLGEPGTGKRAIVEGLAQRSFEGDLPEALAGKFIINLDFSLTSIRSGDPSRLAKLLAHAEGNQIFLVDELHVPDPASDGDSVTPKILKPMIQAGALQCISLATPAGYAQAVDRHPWLAEYFQIVRVNPLGESEVVKVLSALKPRYEEFHGVTYADESLAHAIALSQRFLPSRPQPGKALDLLDDAGTTVKLRMEKERGKLKELEKAQQREPGVGNNVTSTDIEEALARRTGLSVEAIRRSMEQG